MKIIHEDFKHNAVKIKIDGSEDVWYLNGIIEVGDKISGMTERKIKLGGSEEKTKISRRIIHLAIVVEKIVYETSSLRVSGIIVDAPDDIPKGDYHTFELQQDVVVTVEKQSWSRYAKEKLVEATHTDHKHILIVAFDMEEALFALLKNQGYDLLLHLKGDVAKKDADEGKGNFYKDIAQKISEYHDRYLCNNIIIASPAFWKEYLMKEIKDDVLKRKITLANCSSVDERALAEIVKRPELKVVLEKEKAVNEDILLDKLMQHIHNDSAAYGLVAVQQKIIAGNIEYLLIAEDLIRKTREDPSRAAELEEAMNAAESLNASITIVGSEDAQKKLNGLSGIACILRWKDY